MRRSRATFALFASCELAVATSCAAPQQQALEPQAIARPLSSSGYSVIHDFHGSDGKRPISGLTLANGVLYGTTSEGGKGHGVIYSIDSSGHERVVHVFQGSPDGASPVGGLTYVNGTFFGTTDDGGQGCAPIGCGTIFRISPSGSGYKQLYRFQGSADGAYPQSSFVFVDGKFYGTTTAFGGGSCSPSTGACGTVFSITPSGAFKTLYAFGGTDGNGPSELANEDGRLYGTTAYGGKYGYGTVFLLTRDGRESVVYNFKGKNDGASPLAGVTAYRGNLLYGTTFGGGASNHGTVFSVTLSGSKKTIFGFDGANGANPGTPLIFAKRSLYGVTTYGGKCNGEDCGVIFNLSTSGNETVLHYFQGHPPDGKRPSSGLTVFEGKLYGTTTAGGKRGDGTVFAVPP